MFTKKNILLILLLVFVLVFSLSVFGCGQKTEDPVDDDDDNGQDAGPVVPEYNWRFGAFFSEPHHLTQGALKFAEAMEELTDGRVKIDVYPSMQLGGGQEMLEGVQLGTIEMCEAGLAFMAGFDDKFFIFNLPFFFYEPEVAYAYVDGPMAQEMIGEVADTGIRLLGFWENGVRHITSNKGPVVEPDDLRGQKIRTMPNAVHVEAFNQAGALATPLAFGELFTALQQGVVDGQENPLANIWDMSFHEVQDYLTVSAHLYDMTGFYINQDLYASLPADIKDAIAEASVIATKYHRTVARAGDDKLFDEYTKGDYFKEVTVLTAEQKAVWQDAMSGTYDVFREQIGADFLAEVMEEVARLHELYYDGKIDVSTLY